MNISAPGVRLSGTDILIDDGIPEPFTDLEPRYDEIDARVFERWNDLSDDMRYALLAWYNRSVVDASDLERLLVLVDESRVTVFDCERCEGTHVDVDLGDWRHFQGSRDPADGCPAHDNAGGFYEETVEHALHFLT